MNLFQRDKCSPPKRSAFGRGLDEEHAWKNFGGLNLDDAYQKFCESPECYQEDFMFMGSKAFLFYFPVIEKYLKEIVPTDDTDDCEADIIGKACEYQLKEIKKGKEEWIFDRMLLLCDSVITRFSNFELNEDYCSPVLEQWAKLKLTLTSRTEQCR